VLLQQRPYALHRFKNLIPTHTGGQRRHCQRDAECVECVAALSLSLSLSLSLGHHTPLTPETLGLGHALGSSSRSKVMSSCI